MMSGTNSRSACSKRARVSTRWLTNSNPDFVKVALDQRASARHVFQQQDP